VRSKFKDGVTHVTLTQFPCFCQLTYAQTLVAVQVFLEVVGLGESFAADFARVWPLSRVSSHVLLQITGLRERATTNFTHKPTKHSRSTNAVSTCCVLLTITIQSSLHGATTFKNKVIWIRRTCDYIQLNVHYCVLFSGRVRVRIRSSVRLVNCYAHVFVLLSIVFVTLPCAAA